MKFVSVVIAAIVFALAGCNENGPVGLASPVRVDASAAPVALLSLDGAPPEVTARLAGALSSQAQARQISIVPDSGNPRFKLKGYLAAAPAEGGTTVTWVWDVFDGSSHRTQRLSGSETIQRSAADSWSAVDDGTLSRIAGRSMDGVALFLTGGADAVAAAQSTIPASAQGYAPLD